MSRSIENSCRRKSDMIISKMSMTVSPQMWNVHLLVNTDANARPTKLRNLLAGSTQAHSNLVYIHIVSSQWLAVLAILHVLQGRSCVKQHWSLPEGRESRWQKSCRVYLQFDASVLIHHSPAVLNKPFEIYSPHLTTSAILSWSPRILNSGSQFSRPSSSAATRK